MLSKLKIALTATLLVSAVFMYDITGAYALSLTDITIDGMNGFQISGDSKEWLDIKNVNIFGKTYTQIETWANANDWRFATHDEFIELLGNIVPTYLYDSETYDDGHFTPEEAAIIGATDMPTPPAGELQYFVAFIDGAYDLRTVGTFMEPDPSGLYHSFWGAIHYDTLGDINYYGYESALLIKVDDNGNGNGQVVPEPGTMVLVAVGLLGLLGAARTKCQ